MKQTRDYFAFVSPLDAGSVAIVSRLGSVMKHVRKYTAGRRI